MERALITLVCFILAIAIMLLIVHLDGKVSGRKRKQDKEYKKWLAEHGFKEKKR